MSALGAPSAIVRRRGSGTALGVASLVAAFGLAAPPRPALASGLPDDLVAAAALIPVDAADGNGRRLCVQVAGLGDQLRVSTVEPPPGSGDGGATYDASTTGVYLGDGPSDAPAPPFVQALIDAGAAERLMVGWIEYRTVQTRTLPRLQDTGTAGGTSQPPPPMYGTQRTRMRGYAYVVRGPDGDLFRSQPNDWLAPAPLRVSDGPPPKDAPWAAPGRAPPGLRSATWICYPLVPVRVLEYADPEQQPNGLSEVTAAILFQPARMPTWASDYRTFEAMPRHIQPNVVRTVTFRSDGDGWRPEPFPKWNGLAGRLHLVGQE